MEDLLQKNIEGAQEDANEIGLAMCITQIGEEFWTGLWQAWMHNSPDHIKIYPAGRRRLQAEVALTEMADAIRADRANRATIEVSPK